MIACRLCLDSSPHVHHLGRIAAVTRSGIGRSFLPPLIEAIDWGIPALRYKGKWFLVGPGFLERLWPKIRLQLMRTKKDDTNPDQIDPEQDDDSILDR